MESIVASIAPWDEHTLGGNLMNDEHEGAPSCVMCLGFGG